MNVFERAEKYRDALKREGMLEGIDKGTIIGERNSLRVVLSARAFVLTATHESLIESCGELATIQRWLRNAVTARSLDEVFGSSPTE